jgi:hypothetical protein
MSIMALALEDLSLTRRVRDHQFVMRTRRGDHVYESEIIGTKRIEVECYAMGVEIVPGRDQKKHVLVEPIRVSCLAVPVP